MPRFDIDSFRAQFQGGARQYLYYFKPSFPTGVAAGPDVEKATYLVRSTVLPSTNIDEIPLNWQGFDYKIPGKYTYDDFTCTFYVDLDAKILEIFQTWQRMVHDPTTNIYQLPGTVLADQQLELLGLDGKPLVKYKLVGAWPKNIGQVTLDYTANEPVYFDVTFTYVYHVLDKVKYGSQPNFAG
jgi:hypothetical protein